MSPAKTNNGNGNGNGHHNGKIIATVITSMLAGFAGVGYFANNIANRWMDNEATRIKADAEQTRVLDLLAENVKTSTEVARQNLKYNEAQAKWLEILAELEKKGIFRYFENIPQGKVLDEDDEQ